MQQQTPSGPRPVFIRMTQQPLSILEYASESSSRPQAVHHPDSSWSFGHNPNRLSILLRSSLFTAVLLCASAAEHSQWRQALLRVQAAIDAEEEMREQESERQRRPAQEDDGRRRALDDRKADIAERKRRKMQQRSGRGADEQQASRRQLTAPIPTAQAVSTVSPQQRTASPPSYSSLSVASGSSSGSSGSPSRSPSISASLSFVSLPSSRSEVDGLTSSSPPLWQQETSDVTAEAETRAVSAETDDGAAEETQQRRVEADGSGSEGEAAAASGSDSSGAASHPSSASLLQRRSSTRSLSLDEKEMAAMASRRFSTARAVSTGAETRKMTDPTPVLPHSSLQQSQPTSAFASASASSQSPQRSASSSSHSAEEEEARDAARRLEEDAAAALRKVKSRNYQKLFSLSEGEELLADYSCAVQRSILLHGRLYVSDRHACFFSSIFSHKTMIVIPLADILHVQSARVALVFDNSIRVFVQVGPLPVPVRLQRTEEGDSEDSATASARASLRKSSSGSSGSDRSRSSDEHSEDGSSSSSLSAAGAEANGPLPHHDDGEEGGSGVAAAASAASAISGAVAPSPAPRWMLSGSTTLTASFSLTAEQIGFLISVGHPNIVTHFFASFLTRDHALQLLDSLLRQKHGRDGFTSLSSSAAPTAAASANTSPAAQSRSISREQDKKGRQGSSMPTAQPVAAGALSTTTTASSSSSTSSPAPPDRTSALPSSASHETLKLAALHPFHASAVSGDGSLAQLSVAAAPQAAQPPTSPSPTPVLREAGVEAAAADGDEAAADEEEEVNTLAASIDFGAEQPPLGDHRDEVDAPLLDTTFPFSALMFFHLCLADQAPFSLAAFSAQRATDSEYRMTRWRDLSEEAVLGEDAARRREVEGDLIRHIHYRMQFVTPVGPPVTRVHRIQRWYCSDARAAAEGRVCSRLDTCSVTPDITFGDVVIILERLYVEELSGGGEGGGDAGSVRVRVIGGVRFKSRPWKMRPFISLIEQRSRDDSRKGVEDWAAFVRRRMAEEPDKVDRVRARVARLSQGSGLQRFISRRGGAQQQPQLQHRAAASVPVSPARHAASASQPPPLPLTPAVPLSSAAASAWLASPKLAVPSPLPVAGHSGGAASAPPPATPLSWPPALPSALRSSLLASALAWWSAAESSHRLCACLLLLCLCCLLLLGPASGLFAAALLCCAAAVAASLWSQLRRLESAVDDSRHQLQALSRLLMQLAAERERESSEQREMRAAASSGSGSSSRALSGDSQR